jgi:thiamine transporter
MKETRKAVLSLVQISLYAALFIVLDFVSNSIPFFKMPQGGTLGLSVIVLLLASYHLGWKKGLLVAAITIPLQFIAAPPLSQNLADFLMEYVFAFLVYGAASVFPNFGKNDWFMTGVYITNIVRFLIHLAAGVWFWHATWWGSFIYNAWYMVPTLILCAAVLPLLRNRVVSVNQRV